MNVEELCKLIVQNKTPHVRAHDLMGNILWVFDESDNTAHAVDAVKNWLPMFVSYGRVKIQCATPAVRNKNWTGAFKYDIELAPKPTAAVTPVAGTPVAPTSMFEQMTQFVQLMQLMQGIAAPKYELQMEALRNELKHQRELDNLKRENEDPMKFIAPLAPIGMRMMGMKPEEIQQTLQMSAMTSNFMKQPAQQIAGTTLTTDSTLWTLEKAQTLTPEQMTAEIQKLLNGLTDKISGEHFLTLLSILDAKPELAAKAIQLHQSGMI